MPENLILVDQNDNQIGTGEKMEVHLNGDLHRAISVFVFDSTSQLLLQKRANTKYHSPGLWANTCCTHPYPDETVEQAAHRRLKEEMGFDCDLSEAFSFIYKVTLQNNLIEHEYDHVLIGTFDGQPQLNPAEVQTFKWIAIPDLQTDLLAHPDQYVEWLKICFEKLVYHLPH